MVSYLLLFIRVGGIEGVRNGMREFMMCYTNERSIYE